MKKDNYVYKQLNTDESNITDITDFAPEVNTPKVVSFAELDPSVFEYESGSFVVISSCASTPTFENMETLPSDDEG